MRRPLVALAHGGAEADAAFVDGPRRASQAAIDLMEGGGSALDAVIEAVRRLEDDERFNAGRGSNLRPDGRTISMDAALIDSTGRFAGVVGLDDVRNPVLVARDVLKTPHTLLAAPGATRFARRMGHPAEDPRTPGAEARLREWAAAASPTARGARASDTVGALAFDGSTFAAAGSTGGLIGVLEGRVSDIALPGCGLDAGPHGAVCVSGAGDEIVRARVASRLLRLLDEGLEPEDAAARAMTWLPEGAPLAVLVLAAGGRFAARGRSAFPWGAAQSGP